VSVLVRRTNAQSHIGLRGRALWRALRGSNVAARAQSALHGRIPAHFLRDLRALNVVGDRARGPGAAERGRLGRRAGARGWACRRCGQICRCTGAGDVGVDGRRPRRRLRIRDFALALASAPIGAGHLMTNISTRRLTASSRRDRTYGAARRLCDRGVVVVWWSKGTQMLASCPKWLQN